MKKKIIFVSDSLRIGGIQKSLINLLNNFDYNKYDVSVFLFDDENIDILDKRIKVINSNYIFRILGKTSSDIKKKSYLQFFIRLVLAILCKIFTSNIIFNIIFLSINFKEKYDVAISYSNNFNNRSLYYGYNQLVLKKIKAKNKYCWVHIDYIKRKRKKWEFKEYKQFNKIILVSQNCKKNFDKLYSELKSKTHVVYNYIDENYIIKASDEFNFSSNNKNTIISIGRLEKEKNFEMQIEIAKKLYENKVPFKWYIIGEGNNRKELEKLINNYNLNENFILLGSKKNVYPYIKNSKLLVSTSLTESFGLTIAEALILNIPVVVLDYPALKEIIDNNGIVCVNKKQLYESILDLLKNEKRYKKLKELSIYKINNNTIKKQIQNILEGD